MSPRYTPALKRPYRVTYNRYNGMYSLAKEIQRGVFRSILVGYGASFIRECCILFYLTPKNTLVLGDYARDTLSIIRSCQGVSKIEGVI